MRDSVVLSLQEDPGILYEAIAMCFRDPSSHPTFFEGVSICGVLQGSNCYVVEERSRKYDLATNIQQRAPADNHFTLAI